jgi:hypothetical protein
MATAAPFVKLLRQLSNARDEYRSGALDLIWDGGHSSLFLVFGQPNHATFSSDDGESLEGSAALTALLNNLPRKFTVSPWRKEVTRDGTLKLSLDELMEPFAELAGSSMPEPEASDEASVSEALQVGSGYDVEFSFGLDDFPLLPAGEAMFSDAAVNVVHLDLLLPKLPPSLIVLTGPKLRAAAVVVNGQLIDAVWVDDQAKAAGEGAAMAIMGAHQGRLSGYKLENSRVAEALTMLWRCPSRYNDLSLEWLDVNGFLERLVQEKRDCALLVNGPDPGVALFIGGELVAAYSMEQREPTASIDIVAKLLSGAGTLSILQRSGDKPIGRSISESDYHVRPASTPPAPAEPEPTVSFEDVAAELVPEHAADFSPGTEHQPAGQEQPMPDWMVAHEEAAAEASAPSDAALEVVQEPALEAAAPPPAEAPTEAPIEFVPQAAVDEAAAEPETDADTEDEYEGTVSLDAFMHLGETQPETEPEPASEPAAAPEPEPAAMQEPEPAAAPEPEPVAEAAPPSEAPAATWSVVESPSTTPQPPVLLGGFSGFEAASEPQAAEPQSPPGLDFDAIRNDLIQIGVLWLGEKDVAVVSEMIRSTDPTVEAFVATIDAIKAMSVVGHDPSVIRAMAREMHYHAAEYLSGV